MERPNKQNYLTTNQFEYQSKLSEYYKDLELYINHLEKQLALFSVGGSFSQDDLDKEYDKAYDIGYRNGQKE